MKKLIDAAQAQHERNKNALIDIQSDVVKIDQVIEKDEKTLATLTSQTSWLSREDMESYKTKVTQELEKHRAKKYNLELKQNIAMMVIAFSDSNLREAERLLSMVSNAKLPWN